MSKRVIISVINDLATDQRVKRTALTFAEMGYNVNILNNHGNSALEKLRGWEKTLEYVIKSDTDDPKLPRYKEELKKSTVTLLP